MANELVNYIRRLPKVELHLHLEGTVRPETLVELGERNGRPLTLAEAEGLYRYTDFSGFMMAFKAVTERLVTADDYELVTYRMLERLARQGVVHAEVYVSVGVVYWWRRGADGAVDEGVFDPLFAGMERGRVRGEREFGVTLFWIFDAVRHFGAEEAGRVFRKAAQMRAEQVGASPVLGSPAGDVSGDRAPSVVGIGIGGDERRMGAEPFRALYAEAKDAGLRLTAHAGETVGPEGIWGALNIGAERLGHALTAIEDPELMEVLAERQVPVEICVSSNVRTGVCASVREHPLRSYFDRGLMVTLNSDDPAMFGADLEDEYRLAAREFELTREHLRELAANGVEASFLPPERKVELLRALEEVE